MSVLSHFESSLGCGRSDETGLAKFGITPRQKKCQLFYPKRMKYNAKILIVPGLLDRLNEEQQDNIISFVSFLGDFPSQCQKRKNVKSLCLL